jgi:hypothetical protein
VHLLISAQSIWLDVLSSFGESMPSVVGFLCGIISSLYHNLRGLGGWNFAHFLRADRQITIQIICVQDTSNLPVFRSLDEMERDLRALTLPTSSIVTAMVGGLFFD